VSLPPQSTPLPVFTNGLSREHISLGNVACQLNTDLGTLGQFFNAHDRTHGNNMKKILQGPPTLQLPSPAVYLEGFISVKDVSGSTAAHPDPEFTLFSVRGFNRCTCTLFCPHRKGESQAEVESVTTVHDT
jgi:hypothetical protein